jgi:hypothetical protein
MTLRRYARTPILGFGSQFGTGRAAQVIRRGINEGTINFTESELREGDRLDTVAGRFYGDASLWWVIAAASEIGWGLQAPPGTFLRIPRIEDVGSLLG